MPLEIHAVNHIPEFVEKHEAILDIGAISSSAFETSLNTPVFGHLNKVILFNQFHEALVHPDSIVLAATDYKGEEGKLCNPKINGFVYALPASTFYRQTETTLKPQLDEVLSQEDKNKPKRDRLLNKKTAYIYFAAMAELERGKGKVWELLDLLMETLLEKGFEHVELDCKIDANSHNGVSISRLGILNEEQISGFAARFAKNYQKCIEDWYTHTYYPVFGRQVHFRLDLVQWKRNHAWLKARVENLTTKVNA